MGKRIFHCPGCGIEINPAGMLGQIMTDKKLNSLKKGRKGAGRPKGSGNKPKEHICSKQENAETVVKK